MELNWSTFVLEILNFLVLVWILKHFFYQPVLNVIAKRRAGIEKTLADAKTLHSDAEALQVQYQNRLADWEQEKQQARIKLGQELDEERTQKLAALHTELGQEKAKAQVAEELRRMDAMRNIEETALTQAAAFAARLLGQAASPELEARLLDLALEQLSQIPSDKLASVRNHMGAAGNTVAVTSAYPLSESQQQKLQQTLGNIFGAKLSLHYAHDAELLAGIRISLGNWTLSANLQDELKSFAQFTHATPSA